MKSTTFDMKGGALIVGSLLWQNHLWEKGDNIRKNWRKSSLIVRDKISVNVPIRYGRRSGNGVYTMTYANSTRKKLGTGWIIPFKRPAKSFDQLLTEAKALSRAEGMYGQLIKEKDDGEVWSVVCLLINRNKLSAKQTRDLISCWVKELQKEKTYNAFDNKKFKHGSETPCVKPNGLLNVAWCKTIRKKEVNDFDFLLATATLPTGTSYPTIDEIAQSVIADKLRKYFKNNQGNSITTFQDQKIIIRMSAISATITK